MQDTIQTPTDAKSYPRNKKALRYNDAATNPCIKEQQMSLNCIMENYDDQKACKNYFQNVKNCLDFWMKIEIERRRKGIKPALPPVEEREIIKERHAARKTATH